MAVAGDQIATGRHRVDASNRVRWAGRTAWSSAKNASSSHRAGAPRARRALISEAIRTSPPPDAVEERLDTEPVTCREQVAALLVGHNERESPAQVLQAAGTELLVKDERDLAVGVRGKAAAFGSKNIANRPVTVELAVDDGSHVPRLVHQGLVDIVEPDDAEPNMPERHAPIR